MLSAFMTVVSGMLEASKTAVSSVMCAMRSLAYQLESKTSTLAARAADGRGVLPEWPQNSISRALVLVLGLLATKKVSHG